MKKVKLCIAAVFLLTAFLHAQAPQAFKYQSIVRNAAGNPMGNAAVTVRATVRDGAAVGPVVYQETHAVNTNQFGLINLEIGNGIVVSGTFSTISWGTASKWIQIEADFGAGYLAMGTSQLLSVPYALYSGNGTAGPTGPAGPTGLMGAQGATGPQGTAGTNGANGATGPTGTAGTNGATGPQGTAGTNGATGATGPQGTAGTNGSTGATGPTGSTGTQGYSCWDTNQNGINEPAEDVNGDFVWNVNDCNAGVAVPGPQGPTGPQGTAGANGANGPTGPQGTAGTNGATGATGPQGVAGANGADGATGPQGTAGTNGADGATGPQGTAGTNGADGATGATGATGAMGAANISGTTNYVVKFTGATTGGNSLIYDNGTNVGIGTPTPDASSLFTMQTTTKGLLIPRMTTTERDAIASPAASLLLYNTTTKCYEGYSGMSWQSIFCFCSGPPTPGIITGTTPVCVAQSGVVYSIAAVAGATSYQWTVPSGATITAGAGTTTITVTFSMASTSGNVSVQALNACEPSPASNFAVTVTPVPATPGTITGLTPVYQGDAGVVYSISAVNDATSYNWSLVGGDHTISSGAGTTSITVDFGNVTGSTSLRVNATNTCGTSGLRSKSITVLVAP